MKIRFFTILLTLLPLFLNAQSFDTTFKTADWLNEHLDDKNQVILHVDTEENYKSGHIPGAQFIRMKEFTITTIDSIYREMPSISYLDSLFRARGRAYSPRTCKRRNRRHEVAVSSDAVHAG